MRSILLFLCLAVGLLAAAPKFDSASVAIWDVDGAFWIYRSGSTLKRAPASTIKVLSALTAVHECPDLQKWVTVSTRATKMEPTSAGLKSGEQYRVIDLIRTILVASCNDAAAALAEGVSGSEWAFSQKMQAYAKTLGATATVVTNASGLPDPPGMLSTAEDTLLFIRALRKNPMLHEILAIKSFDLVSREGRSTELKNHNRLLRGYAYDVRGKTGYTLLAKSCFLSYGSHEGRTVAVSILGAPGSQVLWKEVQSAYWFALSQKRTPPLPSYMRKKEISLAELHAALTKSGFPLEKEEAFYGSETRKAIEKFQRSHKLTVDGIVGPQTWRSLGSEMR